MINVWNTKSNNVYYDTDSDNNLSFVVVIKIIYYDNSNNKDLAISLLIIGIKTISTNTIIATV